MNMHHEDISRPATLKPFKLARNSPDLDEKWKQLVDCSPKRVVAIFDIQPGSRVRTRWGDGSEDVVAALRAVDNTILGGVQPAWKALVRAGIVDRLCQCISGECGVYDYPPDQPARTKTFEFIDTLHATYYQPLSTIYFALVYLNKTRNKTDQTILNTVKDHWRSMITRLWDEPQAILHPDDVHVDERTLIVNFLTKVLEVYPAMLSIYNGPFDLSLALGVRAWLHSTSTVDFVALGYLFEKFRPDGKIGCAYLKKQFNSILYATGGSATVFYSKFAQHLPVIRTDSEATAQALAFLARVHFDAHGDAIYRLDGDGDAENSLFFGHFIDACLRHSDLWQSVLQSVDAEARPSQSSGSASSSSMVFESVTRILSEVLKLSVDYYPHNSVQLVKLWIRHGLFDKLEEGLDMHPCTSKSAISEHMSVFFRELSAVVDYDRSFLNVLQYQFPRPRLIHALLRIALGNHTDPREEVYVPRETSEYEGDPDSHWRHFEDLDACFQHQNGCGLKRRGCRRKGRKRCKACTEILFCGKECQKRDWNEHKLTCGFGLINFCAEDPENFVHFPFRW